MDILISIKSYYDRTIFFQIHGVYQNKYLLSNHVCLCYTVYRDIGYCFIYRRLMAAGPAGASLIILKNITKDQKKSQKVWAVYKTIYPDIPLPL